MAKLTAIPALSIINGYKGTVDFYVWNGIPCARRWPRSPTGARSAGVQSAWPAFKYAAAVWNDLAPNVKDAYAAMALGTDRTARDMFTSTYYGGPWRDGEWQGDY